MKLPYKPRDSSHGLGRASPMIRRQRTSDGQDYLEGIVRTRHGIVSVYAQGCSAFQDHSRLDFVWKGVVYLRSFENRRLSARTLVTKAREFADHIVQEHP